MSVHGDGSSRFKARLEVGHTSQHSIFLLSIGPPDVSADDTFTVIFFKDAAGALRAAKDGTGYIVSSARGRAFCALIILCSRHTAARRPAYAGLAKPCPLRECSQSATCELPADIVDRIFSPRRAYRSRHILGRLLAGCGHRHVDTRRDFFRHDGRQMIAYALLSLFIEICFSPAPLY